MAGLLPHLKYEYSPGGQTPDAAVIWLHGLGADGHDFAGIVPQLGLSKSLSIRFIFPHAPVRPVTINGGMAMRSWYDILALSEMRSISEAELQTSCDQVADFIQDQIAQGIDSRRIILAGFSQGGAVVLSTALRYEKPLGGVMALSTYLPVPRWIEEGKTAANANIPLLMAHGTMDPVVPYSLAQTSRALLERYGYEVEWHDYPMPHSVCPQQIMDLARWINNRLS